MDTFARNIIKIIQDIFAVCILLLGLGLFILGIGFLISGDTIMRCLFIFSILSVFVKFLFERDKRMGK